MSTTTQNLNLVKPDYGEAADIDVINDNMDTIDSAVGSLRESISKVLVATNVTRVEFENAQGNFNINVHFTDGSSRAVAFQDSALKYYKKANSSSSWVQVWSK